jgi:hypothetical protein
VEEGAEEEEGYCEEGLEPGSRVADGLAGGAEGQDDGVPCGFVLIGLGRGPGVGKGVPVCIVAKTPHALKTVESTRPEQKQQSNIGMEVM